MNFDLSEYLSCSVEGLIRDVLKSSLKNPKGAAFFLQYIKHAKKAIEIREEYKKQSDTNLVKTGLLETLESPLFQKLHASELLLQEHIGDCTLFNRRKEISEML